MLVTTIITITSCSLMGVRQQDLDAWVGMPVEALETHSFFLTVPVYKTRTESGMEIWNYANGREVASCFGNGFSGGYNGYVNVNSFSRCSSEQIVCNNIFYIRDKKVVEYKPTGRCYTDASVQPETRYRKLLKN